jgi:hypothetical protein
LLIKTICPERIQSTPVGFSINNQKSTIRNWVLPVSVVKFV